MLKKIQQFLFSRTCFFGSIILLQFSLITALVVTLSQRGAMVYTLLMIISALIVVWLFSGELNPSYKMVWALMIFIFPLLGGFYFLFWNHIKMPKQLERVLSHIYQQTLDLNGQVPQVMEQLQQLDPNQARQAHQLLTMANAPLYINQGAKYYPSGEDWFVDLKIALQQAQHFIFLEFFIIRPGKMMDELLEILEAKLQAGIEVKLIYDDIGTIFLLPKGYLQTLRRRGIDAYLFNPLTPRLDGFINSRDHRKILVIDGQVAFNGGCNIGDEYINEALRFGYWKDTMVRLEGPAVWSFTLMFLQTWYLTTGQPIDYLAYKRPTPALSPATPSQGFVQPFGATPIAQTTVAENAYLNMINRAKDYVYMTTPYLILDNELITSLCLAALSGVDVRILTPGIPDKKMVFLLTQSYYQTLIKAGVKIYEYTPGFIHAKMFVSDDNIAIVGTANLDFRSLYLHFECCTQFYRCHIVQEVKEDITACLARSRCITAQDLAKTPAVKRIAQSLLRVIAPLM